jgi:predicted DNA-binding ArsR family transcriptional regulator
MDNNEVNALIDAFVGYREMLVPIQSDMHEFLNTYVAMKNDIDKLDDAFSGDVQAKLSEIYKLLASQAEKSEELTRKVDQFLKSSTKYTEEVDNLISMFESIQDRISAVNKLEEKAEEQIGRLDSIIEEKRRNYNLKDLEKSLDAYNANLQAVGDFINNEVAENIVANTKTIQEIKDGNENIAKHLEDEKSSIEKLTETYLESNKLLKKIVEKEDVNEEYIFDILDKWAESRKVKTKK